MINKQIKILALLSDFFNHVNCAINSFNCMLIAVLMHISFLLNYRCMGVWAIGSNE